MVFRVVLLFFFALWRAAKGDLECFNILHDSDLYVVVPGKHVLAQCEGARCCSTEPKKGRAGGTGPGFVFVQGCRGARRSGAQT